MVNQCDAQGEAEEEGGWHLHNALRTEEGLYHPECHKDKDNGMDASNVDINMIKKAGQDEKHDWIASDKVEDKAEEMTEEELVTKNEVRKHFLQFMYLKIML